MQNLLDQMRDDAIDTLKRKIEWRKQKLADANQSAIKMLLGSQNGVYTYEQACSGIITLESTVAVMERHLAMLQPPVVEPAKVKRGRPTKRK
jgi:DNA polymerase elongation subunit (family B)